MIERVCFVPVRMTKDEKERLAQMAEMAGLTVSETVRRCRFGRVITARVDCRAIAALNRLGGLLKHVFNESQGLYSQETAQAINALRDLAEQIARADG